MDSRTNPKLIAVAFEINLTFATGSTMVLPVLAKSPEPTPTILFLIFGFLAIATLLKIGPKKEEQESILDKIEHTVIGMIDESRQEGSLWKANMSSVILDSQYI